MDGHSHFLTSGDEAVTTGPIEDRDRLGSVHRRCWKWAINFRSCCTARSLTGASTFWSFEAMPLLVLRRHSLNKNVEAFR